IRFDQHAEAQGVQELRAVTPLLRGLSQTDRAIGARTARQDRDLQHAQGFLDCRSRVFAAEVREVVIPRDDAEALAEGIALSTYRFPASTRKECASALRPINMRKIIFPRSTKLSSISRSITPMRTRAETKIRGSATPLLERTRARRLIGATTVTRRSSFFRCR